MTVASEITRLQNAKADIKTAIENKWVEVPSSAKLDEYDEYINQIHQGSDFSWTARYVAVLDTNIPDASRINSSWSWWILWYKNGKRWIYYSSWGWVYIWYASYWTTGYDYVNSDSRYTLIRNSYNDSVSWQLFYATYYNWWRWELYEITWREKSWYWYTGRTIHTRIDNYIFWAVWWDIAYRNWQSYPYLTVSSPSIKWDYTSSYVTSISWERLDSYRHILLPYFKWWEVNYYYWKIYSYNSSTAKNIALYKIDWDHNISSESIWSINVTGAYIPTCTSIDWVVLISDWANTYVSTEEWVWAATWYIINTDGTNFAPSSIYWCDETNTYCSGRYKLVPIEDYIQQQWLPIRRKI